MYPQLIKNLIKSFSSLPGVGERAATRYVFHFLKQPKTDIDRLAKNLSHLKKDITLCSQCYNIAQKSSSRKPSLCKICQDPKRDQSKILLVEKISDIEKIENMHFYNGVYHVLGGLINPPKDKSMQKLTFKRLFYRLQQLEKNKQKPELILAINPTREGDLTVNYLKEKLKKSQMHLSRLARGIPTGGELQYADKDTLKEAFLQRRKY
jgi:recombination protein RecR